jgi:hypothetical protein
VRNGVFALVFSLLFRPISADSDAFCCFVVLIARGFQPLRRRGTLGGGAAVEDLCSELVCWLCTDDDEVRARVFVSVVVRNAGSMVIFRVPFLRIAMRSLCSIGFREGSSCCGLCALAFGYALL